jgi:ABC-type polar amino acid transport system ATPase subunit
MTAILSIRGLRKTFRDLEVLKGVDLDVSEGEVVAIIGPSGSGKSTLLRCLNRLEEPTSGEITFEGNLVTQKSNLNHLRARMGMVFQHFNLFPHMTVLGNIIEAPRRVRGLSQERASIDARRLLALVGLGDKENAFPSQLSGGQKQRVAIARTMAMDPRLLLLDEITSALDPELVGDVLEVIRDLAKRGMTMMIVTHEMMFARDVADRIVFMDGGVITECGSPDHIFTQSKQPRLRQFLGAILNRAPLNTPTSALPGTSS